MRLISTRSIEPGDKLSKAIYNERGQILLQSGVSLTKRIIDRLHDKGVTLVYIEDPDTDDIESISPISDKIKSETISSIKESFEKIKNADFANNGFIFEETSNKMKHVVRDILRELQDRKEVISLLSDVFTYDDYIFTHSLNVTIYALALGTELQLPTKKLEEIGLGAILHDIGKMSVPREVLFKPGKLKDEEFEMIKEHSEIGFNILRNEPTIPLLAAHCAFQHHERLDGSGYPRGIQGDEIHMYAKILGIVDVFDAVTSNRVYRKAMLPHEALEILYAGAGTLFDLRMVEAFRKSVAAYPNGLTVTLNDGRKGVVARQNPTVSDRPVIRILKENGNPLDQKYEVDLSKQLNKVITACETVLA